MQGIIFDIRSFSIHDGPGIRQTVFLKGCPLRCAWCHNPESQENITETMTSHKKLGGQTFTRTEEVGKLMSVEGVMQSIEKDIPFFEESGGGVTFSGGEPLMQPEFTTALLTASRKNGIHTALDTCGYAEPEVIDKVLPLTDLFLYDLKLADDEAHKQFTGVSNRPILENLNKISASGKPIIIRIPLIPGITDTEENLSGLKYIIEQTQGIQRIDLLPFHAIAKSKYERMGKTCWQQTENGYDQFKAQEIKEYFMNSVQTVTIGA
ncbi:MAG: glycyl-radical enzyme activating protein [Bacteroidales bacterium]|nr:glycyl-radical enzyme activating protein [Bacteroidales bacterium]